MADQARRWREDPRRRAGRYQAEGPEKKRGVTVTDDPFALLGLPARAGLTDEDVRAAWRRIAAATHPDRDDGGDPARFGAAAAAYVTLRTPFDRGEALADLAAAAGGRRAGRRARAGAHRQRPGGRPDGRQRPDAGRRRGGPPPAGGAATEDGAATEGGGQPSGRAWPGRHAAPAGGQPGRQAAGDREPGGSARRENLAGWAERARRAGAHATGRRPAEAYGRAVASLGYPGLSRGLTLPVASADAAALTAAAATGLTPASIGLLTGALTVTGWALWRRGGPDR